MFNPKTTGQPNLRPSPTQTQPGFHDIPLKITHHRKVKLPRQHSQNILPATDLQPNG